MMDSHKLHLHPEHIGKWLNGENVAPLLLSVSPSSGCNHKCIFCCVRHLQHKKIFLPVSEFVKKLDQYADYGTLAVNFGGEGEPFLNVNMPELVTETKKKGIDVSITTNGVLFSPEKANAILPLTSWIKFSCAAGSQETYTKIHKAASNDFKTLIKNLEELVNTKSKMGYSCTLGVQFILLPENHHEVVNFAKILRDVGVDYFVIKPYMEQIMDENPLYRNLNYGDLTYLEEKLLSEKTDTFNVIFRKNTFLNQSDKVKPFQHCYATPFMWAIRPEGSIYTCCINNGDPSLYAGNFFENSLEEILNSRRYQDVVQFAANDMNIDKCYRMCRLHDGNIYLSRLRNPLAHDKFI